MKKLMAFLFSSINIEIEVIKYLIFYKKFQHI